MVTHSKDKGRPVIFKPSLFGRYYLVERVSRGGMSDIYLGKMVGPGGFQKPLIIKKLFPEYAAMPRYVQRFMNEAKTLAQLNHVNIVQIIDAGMLNGEYYIALEYIEGRNVAHMLSKARKAGRLPRLDFAVYVMMEVAAGLAYAHRKKDPNDENMKLVHQDLNSFNVMISYESDVKIIDFGIARIFLDQSNSNGLPVAGKLLYFSPEQIRGKPTDHRVDIYGAGLFLYELLTGERLVDHQETAGDTVKLILEMDVRARVEGDDRIHPEIKPVLIKAMAAHPEDRYPWMENMIDDLRSVSLKCSLVTDRRVFSEYVRELFPREIAMDKRRLKKLFNEGPTGMESLETFEKTDMPVGPSKDFLRADEAAESTEPSDSQISKAFTQTENIGSGKLVFHHDDPASCVYFIKSGKVGHFFQAGQIKQTIAVLEEGDFFGETGLLDNGYRCGYTRALQDCTLVKIEKDAFFKLIPQDFSRGIIIGLVEKLRDSEALLAGLLHKDDLSRLLSGLAYLHIRNSVRKDTSVDVKELRDMFRLDDSLQVKKYLGKLESLDIVKVNRNRVTVKDLERLKNILAVLTGEESPSSLP